MSWFSLLLMLVPPLDAAAKKDLEHFQGSWKAVAIHYADGRHASEDELRDFRLVVTGTKFTLTSKNFSISGTFAVDASKTPKTIDVLLTSKDGPDTRLLGISQIRGDTRRSCFTLAGKERPRQFSAEKAFSAFEWERE